MNPKLMRGFRLYNLTLLIVTLGSLGLLLLEFLGVITAPSRLARILTAVLLLLFSADYLLRLWLAKGKANLLASNSFHLSALVPTSGVLSPEQVKTVWQRLRQLRQRLVTRLRDKTATFRAHASRFLHRGGLIYYLILSALLIIIVSVIYAIAEHQNYGNALWWAVVTATTVGYGDISPHTLVGRITAVVLMFNGIGLIGTLTSSITAYLADDRSTARSSVAEEIARFDALQKSGAISAKEYAHEKRKLLNKR
ncbi:potassium channel family protein [Lacticaseibacillus mingshuiensis]|uniref:Potassium channel family protein n=1 Tax=Lacticaseibacillus mingshuiensis TaxID=2799574 RepID=A0ABW4CI25_9LACO|nr:potassium channel family protein [Lacticaseibacillus mingshuiensis]